MNLFISENLVPCLGWTLLHFLWQGLVIAGGFAICARLLRSAPANQRYLAGCVALSAMILAPLITLEHEARQFQPPAPVKFAPLATPPEIAAAPIIDYVPASVPTGPPVVVHFKAATKPSRFVLGDHLDDLLAWLVIAWAVGVCALSSRLAVSWLHVKRLKHRATAALAGEWPERLAELMRRLEVSRPVRLFQSALVEVPTVIGWLRPVILLPASCLAGLSPAQLEAVLAHELAHVRRHDYLVNLVQSAVETLLFYHPAVWWISRRIREERELCCDDLAVRVCRDRVAYARALATLEELRLGTAQVAVAAGGAPLLERIRRLAAPPEKETPRSGWVLTLVLALSVVAAVALSLWSNGASAQGGTGVGDDVRSRGRSQTPPEASNAPSIKPVVAAPAPGSLSGPTLTWESVTGEEYEVQVTTNHLNWASLATLTATGPTTTFVEPTPLAVPSFRFYRVIPMPYPATTPGTTDTSEVTSQNHTNEELAQIKVSQPPAKAPGATSSSTVEPQKGSNQATAPDNATNETWPQQVRLAVKFVEISHMENGVLGSDIFLGRINMSAITNGHGGANPSAITSNSSSNPPGVSFTTVPTLNNHQLELVLQALEQRQDVVLLTAPEVITLNEHQVEIQAENAQTVVNSTRASATNNLLNGFPLIGPQLDLVPIVSADEQEISLSVLYSQTESNPPPLVSVPQSSTVQPRYLMHGTFQKVIVHDGETAILTIPGSLPAKKLDDKVPPSGKTPESVRMPPKDLLIFITPTLVNPDGTPYHSEEEILRAKPLPPPAIPAAGTNASAAGAPPGVPVTYEYAMPLTHTGGDENATKVTKLKALKLGVPYDYTPANVISRTSQGREKIKAKLDRIVIDSIKSDELPLSAVVTLLSKASVDRDPDREGINFMFDHNAPSAVGGIDPAAVKRDIWEKWGRGPFNATGGIDPATGLPLSTPNTNQDIGDIPIRIMPELRNMTLAQVLDAVVKASPMPIRYSIEDYAVMFALKPPETEQLFTRTFHIDPSIFRQALTNLTAVEPGNAGAGGGSVVARIKVYGATTNGGGDETISEQPGVRGLTFTTTTAPTPGEVSAVIAFFQAAGIDLSPAATPPRSVVWDDRRGTLMVRATAAELENVAQVFEAMMAAAPQAGTFPPPPRSPGATNAPGAQNRPEEFEFNQPYGTSASRSNLNASLTMAQVLSQMLLQDARVFYEAGKWAEAEARLNQARKFDPESLSAKHYLELIQERRAAEAVRSTNQTPNNFIRTNLVSTSKGRENIKAKLNRIVIDSIKSEGLPLSEVITSLSQKSLAGDPDRVGINFMFDHTPVSGSSPQEPSAERRPASGTADQDIGNIPIRISLRNMTLTQVLDAVVKASATPIRYSIEDYAVMFALKAPEPEQLFTRIFHIDPNTFTRLFSIAPSTNSGNAKTNGGLRVSTMGAPTTAGQAAIIDFFQAAGVDLSASGRSVFWNDRKGTLLVRANAAELETVAQLMEIMNEPPPEINIKCKFVELDEWDFPGHVFKPEAVGISNVTRMPLAGFSLPGFPAVFSSQLTNSITEAFSGGLIDPELKAVLQTLGKQPGVKVLAGAEVTTESGRQAQLLAEEVTGVLTNKNSKAVAKLPFGPALDVLSECLFDGFRVRLTMTATQSRLLDKPDVVLPQMLFDQLMFTTNVWDAETLVLGGAEGPAAPAVGHRKWFLVFVTPTLINPDGTRLHSDDEMPRIGNTPPSLRPFGRTNAPAAQIAPAGASTTPPPTGPPGAEQLQTRVFQVDPKRFAQTFAKVAEIKFEAQQVEVTADGVVHATNDVVVKFGNTAVLTANGATINTNTGDIFADGNVRLLGMDNRSSWLADHLHYNYVTAAVMGGGGGMAGGGGTNFTTAISPPISLIRFFHAAGVDLSPTATPPRRVFWNDRSGTLMVRATGAELKIVAQALEAVNENPPEQKAVNEPPPQINLKVKFVEKDHGDFLGSIPAGTQPTQTNSPSASNPPGVYPTPPSPVAGSASDADLTSGLRKAINETGALGVLTDAQYKVVLQALEQRPDVVELPVPEVTTLSGRQVHFESATNTPSGQSSTNKDGWFTFAPTVDVVPTTSDDRRSIQLSVLTSIKRFVGFENPGEFVVQAQVGAGVPLTSVLPQPHFQVRSWIDKVVVPDGQTAVISIPNGVLMMRNKVPSQGEVPLGNYFNGSGETTNKDLMIFITPTLINPD